MENEAAVVIVATELEVMRREVAPTNSDLVQAQAFMIESKANADDAHAWSNDLKERRDAVIAKLAKLKKKSYDTWKEVCTLENEATEPMSDAILIYDDKIKVWNRLETARIQRENDRKAAEEREAERARREQELKDRTDQMREEGLIEVGEGNVWSITDAGVKALDNHEMYPPGSLERDVLLPLARAYHLNKERAAKAKAQSEPAPAPQGVSQAELAQTTVHSKPIHTAPPVETKATYSGGAGVRENWTVELQDLLTLVKKAAENPSAYLGLVMWNETAARSRAKNEKTNFPKDIGILAFDEGSVTRARKRG